MRVQLKHPARLALALAFGFITASAAAAQEPTPEPQPAPAPAPEPAPAPARPAPQDPAPEKCGVVVDAAGVPINAEPLTVMAAFARDIAQPARAHVASES